jgi:hypothetical protein
MKTSELTGAALDWAVAKCEGVSVWYDDLPQVLRTTNGSEEEYAPSDNWIQGGPIIVREEISVNWASGQWQAHTANEQDEYAQIEYGPTPLIAAMRCFAASKLGDTVEIPDELVEG